MRKRERERERERKSKKSEGREDYALNDILSH
jgi:hypothetical protein